MQKLVIIGGSHAFWEISELINDINAIMPKYEVVGVFDDNTALWGTKYGSLAVEGPIDKVKELPADIKFIFAIGSFKTRIIRSDILNRLNIPDERFETLIHPTAKIFSTALVKHGCVIHYGTVVFNHTVMESFTVIGANSVIAVGNYIGRGSLFGSNVTTTTGVKVGSFSFVGSSSSIGENIEIEPGAQIGMGSLILNNIKAGLFVLGNPLKVLSKTEVPQSIIDSWNLQKEKHKLV